MVAMLTLVISLGAMAQERAWSFGPEVGVSISKYGGDAGTNDYKVGALGGLFLTYSIKNTFGITMKVLYAEKGAKYSSIDTKQTVKYVEIPLLARFFLNKEGSFRPNIFLGPSFGFLTGAANKVGSADRVAIPNYENTFNAFDLGVTGGMGFNILIADEMYFIIDARYTHGLSDIAKSAATVNNNSFGLTAGVSFGLQ